MTAPEVDIVTLVEAAGRQLSNKGFHKGVSFSSIKRICAPTAPEANRQLEPASTAANGRPGRAPLRERRADKFKRGAVASCFVQNGDEGAAKPWIG